MIYLEGLDRFQLILFPNMLNDLVAENNPVRVIDIFINQLDLAVLGFKNIILDKTSPGAPCYSPESLLKLYVFGYFKKVRSSRKLMEMCRTNIEAMWLLGRLTPDFRTISDFRKDNVEAIKKVFKMFTRICIELGLYSTEVGVQDGSKFRADNSKDNNVTESKLEKKMKIAEERINKYLEEMEKSDKEESDSPKYTKEQIQEKIEKLMEKKEEYNALLKEMKEDGVTQISSTDPESRLMKTANGGFDVCYNVQIVADPVSHMVGFVEVTNHCNDLGLMSPVMTAMKDELGIDVIEGVGDKGYEDKADMLECLLNGIIPHVPSKSGAESYELELEYHEANITGEMLDSTKPEDIKACLESGVVPNVYKDKGVEVSINEVDQEVIVDGDEQPCFTLNEAGTAVICPNGSMLNKASILHGKGKTRFVGRAACAACQDKCTTSAFKQVDLKNSQTVLYGKKFERVKRVKIKLKPDKSKTRNRKTVVEHPFGTIKRWNDGYYTLLRGKEKVGADLSLLFLGYNLKRAINMVSVQGLIEKLMGIKVAI